MTTTTQATKLQINWTNNGCDCGNCDFTAETVKGNNSKLFDGDKVICNKCNKIGEIETLGNDGCDVVWSDKYQSKATKCIAVSTPFGLMHLEFDGVNYQPEPSGNDHPGSADMAERLEFKLHSDDLVSAKYKGSNFFAGYFEIALHYGDQFPQ